ncbi:MAG: M13 family metallopeptidase [Bacteroidota bacterium]
MRFTSILCIILLAGTCGLFSCGTKINKKEGKIGRLLDPKNLDSSISPCENFFLFANGSWLKKNPIPANETRWGSLNLLEENNYIVQHELLEFAALNANSTSNPSIQKVGNFYNSGMDTQSIEQSGLTSLKEILKRIDNIHSAQDILREINNEQLEGFNTAYTFTVSPDDKNINNQICKFYQGGLGMPEPEYYYKKEMPNIRFLEAYKNYVERILIIIGEEKNTAIQNSAKIIQLETNLAQASMSRTERQAVYNLYHKFSIAEANRLTQNMNWGDILFQLNTKNEDSIIIGQPDYYLALSQQLKCLPTDTWKVYLRFHLINTMAPYLSKDFANAHFDFYGKTIRGLQKKKERWKFVQSVIDASIGELLGQMYVDKTFKPEAKKRMSELVDNIQMTYREQILLADWMTEATKKKAVQKLDAITKKIGYPDKIKDYSKLNISPNDFAKNVLTAATFQYNNMISKLGKPVNKNEWNLTSTTVNARYNLAFNEIVFPAGLLQYSSNYKMTEDISRYEIIFSDKSFGNSNQKKQLPYKIILPSGTLQYPYFIENADDAVNYGSIGAFIAHEMSHGFDNRGRHYDAGGNLNNWWTTEDERKFNEKAEVLINQFNKFTVLDTLHVDGNLTLGENIADLTGITIAYKAFKKTRQGKGNELIDGFTPDQRFFLSWAQLWREASTDEETKTRIKLDHHAPYIWRCNGILSNLPEFHQAFGVRKGDKMFINENLRAKIW